MTPFSSKRLFDVVAASLGLILFVPVFITVTLLILLEDGLPVLFVQERLGKGMQPFRLYKFRSMRDGQVTRVGRWIRVTGLDELLQFFNVLQGSMGLVGPRPMTMQDVVRLGWNDPGKLRWRCNPGMTGLAQLYAGRGSAVSRFLDERYVCRQDIFLDVQIAGLSFLVNCIGKRSVHRGLLWWRSRQRDKRRRMKH